MTRGRIPQSGFPKRLLPHGGEAYHSPPSFPPPAMAPERKPFVNVDELMPQVSLEQAALFYGVQLPELKRVGAETRTACFLLCGKDKETGDRALAIQTDDPSKKWKCHQYGCTKGG